MERKLTYKFEDDYQAFLNPARFYSDPDLSMYILIGGRGIGKTTGFVKNCLRRWVSKDEEFVYCRRYKTEMMKTKDLLSPIVEGCNTKGIGNGIFQYQYNKVRIGYSVALSMQQSFKSGVDFSKVGTLIYDEALIEEGAQMRYLPHEINALLELISTIFRFRTGYHVFVLSNNADMFNPYFAYFNLPKFKDRYIDKSRALYAEMLPNKAALMKIEEKTPLYRLTKGTAYGDYHYSNEVLSDAKGTIASKPINAELWLRIVYEQYTLNIYRIGIIDMYVEFRDKPIQDDLTYTIMQNEQPNYIDIKRYRENDVKSFVDRSYYKGKVLYSEQKAVALMQQFMEEV